MLLKAVLHLIKAPAAGKQQIKKSTNEKSMIALVAIGLSFSAKAQSSDSISTDKITFSAYAEVFYSYNFNEPKNHISQTFYITSIDITNLILIWPLQKQLIRISV